MGFFRKLTALRDKVLKDKTLISTLYFSMLLYLVMVVWITAVLALSPLFIQSSNPLVFGLGVFTYNYGYLLSNCHQLPERSLFLFGGQIPLCARDMGTYVGCIIGILLPFFALRIPHFFKSKKFLAFLLLPLVIDGVTQTIFVWRESSNTLRFVTGVLFGFSLAYYATTRILSMSDGLVLDKKKLVLKAVLINSLLFLVLLAMAFPLGSSFTTKDRAVSLTGEIQKPHAVFYVPPRVAQTIHSDPYLKKHDDTVLNDLYYSIGLRNRNGVWVVAYVSGISMGDSTVYLPESDGVFYYLDAESGTLIRKIAH